MMPWLSALCHSTWKRRPRSTLVELKKPLTCLEFVGQGNIKKETSQKRCSRNLDRGSFEILGSTMPHIYGTRLTEAKQRIQDRVLENRYFGGQIPGRPDQKFLTNQSGEILLNTPSIKMRPQKRYPLKEDYFNLKGYLVQVTWSRFGPKVSKIWLVS